MSQQEEQPRLSLRLRKTPDRPPDTPAEAPKADAPKPAAPAQPAGEPVSRPRLSSIIKPGSGASTPPAPPPSPPQATPPLPTPPAATPPPVAFEPAPAPVQRAEPVPAPAPELPKLVKPEPAPPPAAATPPPSPAVSTPPPPPTIPKPVAVESAAPIVEAPLPPGDSEQPRGTPDADATPKPPSPRTLGLVMVGLVVLVLGGIAYVWFMDPFGIFSEPAPVQASTPAATTPAPAPATVAPAPASTQPSAPAPAPEEVVPEFKMPEPAPLVGGEEIAPGVVRLPPDAAPVSEAPAPRRYDPPAPKTNPAYTALVNNLNISGIRANTSGGFLMIGTLLYRPGDIVDVQSKLEFVGIEGQVITFRDPAGALYTRRF